MELCHFELAVTLDLKVLSSPFKIGLVHLFLLKLKGKVFMY